MCPEALEPAASSAAECRAVRKHFHADGECVAARRDLERIHIERVVGDPLGLALAEPQSPHLRAARAVRQEVERAAVGGPARARIVARGIQQAPRLGLAVAHHQPEAGVRLVGGEISIALHIHHVTTIRGELRIADAFERDEVLDRERYGADRVSEQQAAAGQQPRRGSDDHVCLSLRLLKACQWRFESDVRNFSPPRQPR
jgi:hypothetical protein